jgi:GntR family transcriptional regulator/MocR family aminotransferase
MEKSRSQNKRGSIAGMHIDRASAVPIYLQIAAHLRAGLVPLQTTVHSFFMRS